MIEIKPEWVSAIAAGLAAIASFCAVVTAFLAYKLERKIARNNVQFLREQNLLQIVQSVIVIFADIHATAKQSWSKARTEELRSLSENLRYNETVIKSLRPDIGDRIERWRLSEGSDGNSVSRVIDYVLGGMGAVVGDQYDDFLFSKAAELREIQEGMFDEIAK